MSTITTQLAIVGAGPAGLCAAIAAKEQDPDCEVLVLDRMPRAGNKIYATGNGRCNLTNLHQTPDCYHSDSAKDPFSYLGGIGAREVFSFVEGLGVRLYDRDGYVYPKTNQASSVALPLVHRAEDCGAKIQTGVRVTGIRREGRGFCLLAREEKKGGESLEIHALSLLLSCGGMVSRAFGDEGDGAKLAASLGHQIIPLLPALTYLATSAPGMKVLAGVRANGACALYADGKPVGKSEGEIQFTEGALSGIPFFQLSHAAGRALAAGKKVEASVCFLPDEKKTPEELLLERLALVPANRTAADLLLGLVSSKAASFLLRGHGIADEKKLRGLTGKDLLPVFAGLFDCRFPVTGLGPAEHAQVSAGGVDLREVDVKTLASKRVPGLYFAGEILDLDGICGGYNLTFAFSSGLRAGRAAAQFLRK